MESGQHFLIVEEGREMNTRTIECREHGGTFQIPVQRGRPPVKCNPDNRCTEVARTSSRKRKAASQPERVASTIKNRRIAERTAETLAGKLPDPALPEPTLNGARKSAEPRTTGNVCVDKAYAARELLEPLGWVTTARGWHDGDSSFATLTASRDTELITLIWQDGQLTDQAYSIWNTEVTPEANGKPATNLPFNVDEMTDRELVQHLAGMTVQWWNRLGQSVEHATIPSKVQIEHAYSGTGDETPGDRIVKFVDLNGSGYRAFRIGSLTKVGSK